MAAVVVVAGVVAVAAVATAAVAVAAGAAVADTVVAVAAAVAAAAGTDPFRFAVLQQREPKRLPSPVASFLWPLTCTIDPRDEQRCRATFTASKHCKHCAGPSPFAARSNLAVQNRFLVRDSHDRFCCISRRSAAAGLGVDTDGADSISVGYRQRFQTGNQFAAAGISQRLRRRYQAMKDEGGFEMDYSPGRLLVATLWTRWVRLRVDGPQSDWQLVEDWQQPFYERAQQLNRQDELCRPLLILNGCGEFAAAIAMFVLVRHWTGRRHRPGVAAVLGLIAAIFLWFNAEVIWNAHCWPQSDCLLLPFMLWALVAASADFWAVAGIMIAGGMMFKSQILFGAPLLILWPLWRGKLLAILRFCVGFYAAPTAGLTAVWLCATSIMPITRRSGGLSALRRRWLC